MATPTTEELAIQAWVADATGIPGQRVIWWLQYGPRPETPYITLRLTDQNGVGRPWTDTVKNDDPTPGAAEVAYKTRSPGKATLSVQCAADSSIGSESAVAILRNLQLLTPAHVLALNAAGVGVGSFGVASPAGGTLGTVMAHLAAMEVNLHLRAERTTTGTAIHRVEATNENTGKTYEIGALQGVASPVLDGATLSADGTVDASSSGGGGPVGGH